MPKKKNKNSKSKKSSKKKNGSVIQGWMQRINATIAWLTTDTKPQNNTSTKKKKLAHAEEHLTLHRAATRIQKPRPYCVKLNPRQTSTL
ncbi:hypothetical protein WSS15_16650 [Acetobacter pasteurianus]|nr:hypothetical protein WSS15_16650 [Acetobacter pasteurianus]